MSQKVCKKCCQPIYKKDLVTCQVCRSNYHVLCMDAHTISATKKTNNTSSLKSTWKCVTCIRKQNRTIKSTTNAKTSTPQTKIAEELGIVRSPLDTRQLENQLKSPKCTKFDVLTLANTSKEHPNYCCTNNDDTLQDVCSDLVVQTPVLEQELQSNAYTNDIPTPSTTSKINYCTQNDDLTHDACIPEVKSSELQHSPIPKDDRNINLANRSRIKFRRQLEYNKQLNRSEQDFLLSDSDYSIENLSTSLPTQKPRANDSIIDELQCEIGDLREQLQSANTEIENLNLENKSLKKIIEHYEMKIKIYKSIGIDDLNTTSTSIKSQRSRKRNNTSSLGNIDKNASIKHTLTRAESLPNDTVSEIKIMDNKEEPKILTKLNEKTDKKQAQEVNDTSSEIIMQINQERPKLQIIKPNEISDKEPTKSNNNLGCKNRQAKNLPPEKTIFILGDQQASGLAVKLKETRKERHNLWNDGYKITSITKPCATCEHVLMHCNSLQNKLNTNDRVIILIGANDKNPYKILGELSSALNKLRNTKVLVIPTLLNPYLNEKLLNNSIAGLVRFYDNCTFIQDLRGAPLDKLLLSTICKRINFEINYSDYKNLYLNFNSENKKWFTAANSKRNSSNIHYAKGTIPYFFNKMKQNAAQVNKKTVENTPSADNLNQQKPKQDEFFRAK